MRGIGKKIKKIREFKNLTQKYVAEQLGITQSQYSRFENEVSLISEDYLQELSKIFEMSLDKILSFEEIINDKNSQYDEIQEILNLIEKEFRNNYKARSYLEGFKSHARFFTISQLVSKIYYTEEKILFALRNQNNFRLQTYKSHNDVYFSDVIVVEKVFRNIEFGYFERNLESNLWIINPIGCYTRGINHFCYTLYDNLQCNYSALTEPINNEDGTLLKYNRSKYFAYYGIFENYKFPKILDSFLTSFIYGNVNKRIPRIQKKDWVFIICAAASGRPADVIIEYGKPQYSLENDFTNSTIQDHETFLQWKTFFLEYLNINHLTYFKSIKNFQFRYAEHLVGNESNDWLGKCIHRITKANVVTIYININILIGLSDIYFAMLKCLLLSLKKVFCNFVEEKLEMKC